MDDSLRIVLAVVILAAGVAMVGYAGYLQYVSLPEEHTFRTWGVRGGLLLGGAVLIVAGSRLP